MTMKTDKHGKRMWNMKITPEFYDHIEKVADVTDQTASRLVREAVKEKLARLAEENPKVAEILQAA